MGGSRTGLFLSGLGRKRELRPPSASTPTALRPLAQGCPPQADYPGLGTANEPFQPQRGCGPLVSASATPLGLRKWFSWDRRPRVAAKRRNPGLVDVAPLGQGDAR